MPANRVIASCKAESRQSASDRLFFAVAMMLIAPGSSS